MPHKILALYLALFFSATLPSRADQSKLKQYSGPCGKVEGLPLMREVDAEADAALTEWYTLLNAQAEYVTKCQAITEKMSQVGQPMDEFKAARKNYFDELNTYKKLNSPRPAKIMKLSKALEMGGETVCRAAIQNEFSMMKNREETLKNTNCKK